MAAQWVTIGPIVVGIAAIAVTLWIGSRQLANTRAATRIQLHLHFLERYEGDRLAKARSRVANTLLGGQFRLNPSDTETVLDHFETIGDFADRGLLDDHALYNDFSEAVRVYWHQLNNYVHGVRRERGDATFYIAFEKLAQQMAREEAKRRKLPESEVLLNEDRIKAFLDSEREP
jgi:hypothetical protein